MEISEFRERMKKHCEHYACCELCVISEVCDEIFEENPWESSDKQLRHMKLALERIRQATSDILD